MADLQYMSVTVQLAPKKMITMTKMSFFMLSKFLGCFLINVFLLLALLNNVPNLCGL